MSYTLVLEWMPGDLYMSAVTARCTAPTSSYSVVWLPPNKVYQITLYCGSTSLVSFLVGAFRGKAWSYMKGFERKNQLFSLCGLNCGLCPMFLGKHCGGCGNGNQSCGIAKCSLEHGKIEYCYECESYPCEKYRYIDKYDSFITHKRQKADLKMIQDIGVEQYNLQQREKMQILSHLLANYNDGRRKNFFCVAVNLLELSELQEAMKQIQQNDELSVLSVKEQCSYIVDILQKIADRRNIELKLVKK